MKRLMILLLLSMVFLHLFSPFVKAEGTKDDKKPKVESEAAVLLEENSGQVLYQKNADKKMYPASLTKIATAIFVIENYDLSEVVTVSENAVATIGTKVYLEKGERVTLKKLVKGMLINSGNDAGVAIAEHVSGSVEQFASELNDYLYHVIGVENTHFTNPHGLFDEDHYTTAIDLAKITQYALQNETFKEIFGTKELEWDGESWDTTILTHHLMLKGEIPYEEVTGGKTGFIDESGYTLATSAENEAVQLIVITMNSDHNKIAYQDTANLLDYGLNAFKNYQIHKGTKYALENAEYIVPDDFVYTLRKDETAKEQVNDQGVLHVFDENGHPVSSLTLEPVNLKQPLVTKKSNPKSPNNDDVYEFIPVLFFIFVITLFAFLYWKRKNQIPHS